MLGKLLLLSLALCLLLVLHALLQLLRRLVLLLLPHCVLLLLQLSHMASDALSCYLPRRSVAFLKSRNPVLCMPD